MDGNTILQFRKIYIQNIVTYLKSLIWKDGTLPDFEYDQFSIDNKNTLNNFLGSFSTYLMTQNLNVEIMKCIISFLSASQNLELNLYTKRPSTYILNLSDLSQKKLLLDKAQELLNPSTFESPVKKIIYLDNNVKDSPEVKGHKTRYVRDVLKYIKDLLWKEGSLPNFDYPIFTFIRAHQKAAKKFFQLYRYQFEMVAKTHKDKTTTEFLRKFSNQLINTELDKFKKQPEKYTLDFSDLSHKQMLQTRAKQWIGNVSPTQYSVAPPRQQAPKRPTFSNKLDFESPESIKKSLLQMDPNNFKIQVELEEAQLVYQSPTEYFKILQPLLINEMKAQVSNQLKMTPPLIPFVADFNDNGLIGFSYEKLNTLVIKNDLIVIYEDIVNLPEHSPKKIFGHIISHIETKKLFIIRIHKEADPTFYNQIVEGTKRKTGFLFRKIYNWFTFDREYNSLREIVKSGPLIQYIVNPTSLRSNNRAKTFKEIAYKEWFDAYHLNDSQITALILSLTQKFTLIHGPPGTGKTNVVIALIAASLRLNLNKHYRILVCAPSHAAVDEIAKRLIYNGVSDGTENGRLYPRVCRIGRKESISKEIHPIALWGKKNYRQILKNSTIILSTLAGAGNETMESFMNKHDIDLLIIDEASQSVEPSALIPLKQQVAQVVMIGDANQLAPTTFAKESEKLFYKRSLFERFFENGVKTEMLRVQYRMHPTLANIISRIFYQGKLINGYNVRDYEQNFYKKYRPLTFFNIPDSKELSSSENKSFANQTEVDLIFLLIQDLFQNFPETKDMSIGIITGYKHQRKQIQDFKSKFKNLDNITINTVDGFQGQQQDIIFFSTVRVLNIGFLGDVRRMNVALSRAKYANFILGNLNLLSTHKEWKEYLDYVAKNKGMVLFTEKHFKDLKTTIHNFDKNSASGPTLVLGDPTATNEVDPSLHEDEIRHENDDQEFEDEAEVDLATAMNNLTINGNAANNINQGADEKAEMAKLILTNTYDKYKLAINLTHSMVGLGSLFAGDKEFTIILNHLKQDTKKQLFVEPNYQSQSFTSRALIEVYGQQINASQMKLKGDLIKKIEAFLSTIPNKKYKVKPYGSYVSGVAIADSDVDLCITNRGAVGPPALEQEHLHRCFAASPQFHNIVYIREAKVPIIRFKFEDIDFDISFNPEGQKNSKLIKLYSTLDNRAHQLLILVKYWASKKGISSAANGFLSSYSWANMVIFSLMCVDPPVLPCLASNPLAKNNWSSTNTDSIDLLLFKFFKLYSNFDFKDLLISVSIGKISKVANTPRMMPGKKFKNKLVVFIQDLLIPDKNTARGLRLNELEIIQMELLSALYIIETSDYMDIFSPSNTKTQLLHKRVNN
ncbi:hypothetical protein CYY_005907 [Polysphondylium violaceum]|uniref:Helicase ATP-binding domain-containing protein n=1 Tax=Polysphondylium violaceum TaxID=133409 RepID=A0A8J4PUC2_9MYCE|nr:hypothetical protein CYY_005907 [Polysphondylium violaceum]